MLKTNGNAIIYNCSAILPVKSEKPLKFERLAVPADTTSTLLGGDTSRFVRRIQPPKISVYLNLEKSCAYDK